MTRDALRAPSIHMNRTNLQKFDGELTAEVAGMAAGGEAAAAQQPMSLAHCCLLTVACSLKIILPQTVANLLSYRSQSRSQFEAISETTSDVRPETEPSPPTSTCAAAPTGPHVL